MVSFNVSILFETPPMTLIQSAKLNGLDPYAYLSDVLKRLPTHKVTQIEELLPHRWKSDQN